MDSIKENLNMPEFHLSEDSEITKRNNQSYLYFLVFPILIVLLVIFGFVDGLLVKSSHWYNFPHHETKGGEIKNSGKFNILSSEDLAIGIKDSIYTDKDCWLELRIDQQTLYQHWRDGRTEKYPVSTGNHLGKDPKAIESRPGLFAIFLKEEHHISSQFDAADMYHFMPFNQGIGFHALKGTGYYSLLGVRPASHGCIRMKHDDVKKLYEECEIGTLVLASKGYSARAVAFAPQGFKNEKDYSKDQYKNILASNLYNILKGRYYYEEREKFVIDPKIIPPSGIYTSYDVKIPERQIIPRSYVSFLVVNDAIKLRVNKEILQDGHSDELVKLVSNNSEIENNKSYNKTMLVNSTDDLIKKYFNNPIGILPYFGPKK